MAKTQVVNRRFYVLHSSWTGKSWAHELAGMIRQSGFLVRVVPKRKKTAHGEDVWGIWVKEPAKV